MKNNIIAEKVVNMVRIINTLDMLYVGLLDKLYRKGIDIGNNLFIEDLDCFTNEK